MERVLARRARPASRPVPASGPVGEPRREIGEGEIDLQGLTGRAFDLLPDVVGAGAGEEPAFIPGQRRAYGAESFGDGGSLDPVLERRVALVLVVAPVVDPVGQRVDPVEAVILPDLF